MNRSRFLFVVVLGLFLTFASGAFAQAGMIHTGDSVRVKSVGPFTAKVYAIRHDMKERPAQKSKQAVIDADVDKKFTWTMLRDVDSSKIQKALKDAFALNGFGDQARIGQFVGAFNKDEVKEKSAVVITYNAAAKTTTIWVQNGGSATIAGQDFMKAAWSIWFGKIDQPAMGDQLLAKL
ncbi:MAG: chalcone isomerase family protein [Labilithrix sp.]|nr:chalcone isomerase family protein [Labilithrix sp.]